MGKNTPFFTHSLIQAADQKESKPVSFQVGLLFLNKDSQ